MARQIYLLRDDTDLVPMEERQYDSESLLQTLLAKHPNLLAGEQMDSDSPRRWLLIGREVDVPGEEDGARRWSLDHLFLDQDGIPTLVEVKRSTDTRIRREVVGQMLDYAANAVAYWPIERIRARFESRCESEGKSPSEVLAAFLGAEQDPGIFWTTVKTNLQAGRVRLVFVADVIPDELRRVIEFLNGQMDPAEVLAVEIRQFVSGTMRTMVPRVMGQTAAAQGRKRGADGERRTIGAAEFASMLSEQTSTAVAALAMDIVSLSRNLGMVETYVKGTIGVASYTPSIRRADRDLAPISLRTDGELTLQMRSLYPWPPYSDAAEAEKLRQRCNTVPGWKLRGGMAGVPKFDLPEVVEGGGQTALLDALKWMFEHIRDSV